MSERLPFTALVSSRDEAHFLGRCLDSIAFCEEIIVVDIDSRDDTAILFSSFRCAAPQAPCSSGSTRSLTWSDVNGLRI